MKVSLKDADVVPATTTDIVPDEGHLHVILDDQLISMTGDTTQILANLTPGQHLLKVEFVASDHAPFDPRVIAVGRVRGGGVSARRVAGAAARRMRARAPRDRRGSACCCSACGSCETSGATRIAAPHGGLRRDPR